MYCVELFMALERANKSVIHLHPSVSPSGTGVFGACVPSKHESGCCTKVYLQALPVAVMNVTKVLFTCYHSVIPHKAKDDFSLGRKRVISAAAF